MEQVYFKPYYVFGITWQGEEYELAIPPYERRDMENLTGMRYNDKERLINGGYYN